MENPYYISELESEDLYCEFCGRFISTHEYINNDGLCNDCFYIEMDLINDYN